MAHFATPDILNIIYGFLAAIGLFILRWFISNFLKKSSKLESDRFTKMESKISQNEIDIKELTKEWINESARLDERLKAMKETIDDLKKKAD